jgi:hypothetical protein
MSEQPPARRWYQLGSADIVFLVLCVIIFQAARGKMLSDPGLGWHLRNIDAMIAEGGWLHTDPFTQPRDGEPPAEWRTNQWLGELPLWLGERWAGREGVAAVATLILALTLRILYSMLLRDGLPWPLAVLWLCAAGIGTACSWIARPNLFSMLFVLLTVRLVEQFHAGRCTWRRLLWLPPLFAVWANTHGGFVAGYLILVPAICIEALLAVVHRPADLRTAARRRGLILLGFTAACFLATLLNPYGWTLYPWVLKLLGNPYFMSLHEEWKRPPLTNTGALQYVPLFVLYPVVILLSRRRPSLLEVGLTGAWLLLALKGFRYVPLWVLMAVPVMARASYGIPWVKAFVDRHLSSADPSSLFALRNGPAPSGVWSVVLAVLLVGGSRWLHAVDESRPPEARYVQFLPDVVDADALDELVALHRDRTDDVVFHSYNWGGYLTWEGWRTQRLLNWIDDRNEVQGEQHIRETFRLLAAEPGWHEALDKAHVRFVCIERGEPLAAELAERPNEWEKRYEDGYAVIFERRKRVSTEVNASSPPFASGGP